MQRCLAALGVVLALVLAAGVGTARAGDPGQTLSQTQSATNSVDQNAQAGALSVNASPNIAVLNAGSVDQSSTSSADATASNENNHSTQTVDESQSADQTKADSFCCGRYADGQSTDQSQSASNSVDQNAQAGALSVNASPNVAALNKGDVTQSSSSDASATATNTNSSSQSIAQTQDASQWSGAGSHCCGSGKQEVDQTQTASNSVDQDARAGALSVNASPNVALLNKGHVTQASSSGASSTATNTNSSSQSIDQSQSATQRSPGGRCCKRGGGPSVDQSQDASNSISQNARARAISVNASPNVAALNWGSVNQSSGSHASATATNTNSSSQSIEQNQRSLQSDSAGRHHHRHHVKHHRHHGTWGPCSA